MAVITPFFNSFPKIKYDINNQLYGNYEDVTNIFHRIGVLRDVINNASSYIVYEIEEHDTPEIVAEKMYNDAGAGWIIIYANNIIDPQWDWPLNEQSFQKYIIEKYGSVENAKITNHHYEKLITRTVDGITTETKVNLSERKLTENIWPIFEYYEPYSVTTHKTADSLYYNADNENVALLADLENDAGDTILQGGSLGRVREEITFNVNGTDVQQVYQGVAITNYDWEYEQNEAKRTIKIIKAVYYTQIMDEFKQLTNSIPKYVRTFV